MYTPTNGCRQTGDGLEGQAMVNCREETVRTVHQIRPVLDRIRADMAVIGYVPRDIFAVRIAVREALLNAIQHGHRGDPTRCVRLTYLVTPAYVLAEVMDEGPGFDPTQVPIPALDDDLAWSSGRGLFLMRQLMTWTRFNRRGNVCVLCKRRSSPTGTRPAPATNPQEEDPWNCSGS
jgi:serine/threonine-protein kinase RsbW